MKVKKKMQSSTDTIQQNVVTRTKSTKTNKFHISVKLMFSSTMMQNKVINDHKY